MNYELIYEPRFEDALEALDNSFAPIALKALRKIEGDPYRGKALHERWGYFEMRFDPYRITYLVDEATHTIKLLELGKRDSIFR